MPDFRGDLLIWQLCSSVPTPQGIFSLVLTALLIAFSNALGLKKAEAFLLLLLSHAVLLAAMLCALQRRLWKRRPPLPVWELCYLSLVPMAGVLFGQMTARLLFEMKDGELLQLFERHPAFLAVVPVIAL